MGREAEYQKISQGHLNTTQAVQPHQLVREVASNFCDSALKEAIKRSLEMQQKKSLESNETKVCDKADSCSESNNTIIERKILSLSKMHQRNRVTRRILPH